MDIIVVGGCALLGLVLGSFANVVIHRVPLGQSIVSPPSACPTCGARLRARHNIPLLSWLWLRRSCYNCRAPISARYPLVELTTAVLFTAVAMAVGLSWELPLLLILAFFTVVLTAVDLETRRLPDRIVGPFALATVVAIGLYAWLAADLGVAGRSLVGAAALGVFYFVAFLAYPKGMGFGDVKLAPVLGATLGAFGWAQLAVGGIAAFAWGSIVGIVTMLILRQRRGVVIPFGPWMFLGAWTGLVVGEPLARWYLNVTGLA